ncbi:FAD-dependent oxidoreductase (plasmid) [Sulfitobacter sp. S190]|nr:FAD-dependent oxidoreductase [Sulfitobacter sp. S190]
MSQQSKHIAIIGAGIGGLSAALRLAHTGARVSVFERHAAPGGKMRTLPSVAGPVDAGPTVLTMKPVFDALFSDVGARLEDHVTLEREPLLARHFWRDGTMLDLMADHDASARNVEAAFDTNAARAYDRFCDRTARLFDAFDAPMMKTAAPTLGALTAEVARRPALIRDMAPHQSLATMLRQHFAEPKLAQLFARYATYVGGLPSQVPALLCLVWEAERRGVWHVKGGMHQLARAIARLATSRGAQFHFDTHISRIEVQDGAPCAVVTSAGRIPVDAVLFNGDPKALVDGHLGTACRHAVAPKGTTARSLSANVLSFAARPTPDIPLAAHNVFFAADPDREYLPLIKGQPQTDPTLYVCAQDRFGGQTPLKEERFEIILNAPPVPPGNAPPLSPPAKEIPQCQTLVLNTLRDFGLRFSPAPDPKTLTTPAMFNEMFPGSTGSLYGRSPQGMMAAFQRPTVTTAIPGLYLVGGGVHPGAGVPMATLCAAHAAAAIQKDLCLTSTSHRAVMLGGMSTA